MSLKQLKIISTPILLPGLIALTALLAGCGGKANRDGLGAEGIKTNAPGYSSDDTSDDAITISDGFVPSVTYSFTLQGPTDVMEVPGEVGTDNMLKIRIKPAPAGNSVGSGFSANYTCISYVISVLGQDVRTKTLSLGNGGHCKGGPTSQVIDFSGRLTPGHGPVQIKVSAARSDFKYNACLAYPFEFTAIKWITPYWWVPDFTVCNKLYYPTTPLYANDTAAGDLEIQVNGADSL